MVTLTGPGGTGKSRLSLAVGAQLLREMSDGVWWMSLAPIRDARLVVSEIAAVFDVHEGGASLLDGVRNALRDELLPMLQRTAAEVSEDWALWQRRPHVEVAQRPISR